MIEQPKAFRHFAIVRILGRGGMGVVYLANDERLGRPVALKVLDVYDLPDAERRSRFLREARAAAAIRHPNIATIYEVGETEDAVPYLAMEYCEGVTLAQLIRRGALPAADWVNIAQQIGDGVAAAHRNGVIHRDIKSANIVLEDDQTVKILDFGLAKRFEKDETHSPTARLSGSNSSFFGTLPYISPEQTEGAAADARSDLFSVGVVLYELATGKLPFDADSPLQVMEKIRDAEPEPFQPFDPAFPPEAAAIIGRLLQKNPDDRFQTADELADALHALHVAAAPGRATQRSRSTRLARTVRHSRRHAAMFIGSIAAIVVALTVAAVLWMPRGRQGFASSTASPAQIRSLAVLPLKNLSQNSSDAFLSLGLADALVTKLQQLPDIQVRPTSAIIRFQREQVDAKAAGEALQVDGVLEGHFLSTGDQVRVNLQLTDTRTGYGVWAGSVDGRRDNLIRLMDQVSSTTAAALNQELGTGTKEGRSEVRTENPAAYESYLKARSLIGTFNQEVSDAQVKHLKQAIALDPEFAGAYAELAITLSLRRSRGFAKSDDGSPEWYARRAVRLDPNLAAAHSALESTLARDPDRYSEAVRENLAALRLDPNDTRALYSLVTYFVATGEMEKAACIGDVYTRQDPTSNEARARGYWNVNAVDPEGSLRLASLALSSPDTALAGHDISALGHLMLGNVDEAEKHQKEASRVSPGHYIGPSLAAMIAAARGDRPTAERNLALFGPEAERNHWAMYRCALVRAKLGDYEKAVDWVERASRNGSHSWYFLVKHPWLQPLQQNVRFQRVVSEIKKDIDFVRDDVIGVYQLICPNAKG